MKHAGHMFFFLQTIQRLGRLVQTVWEGTCSASGSLIVKEDSSC